MRKKIFFSTLLFLVIVLVSVVTNATEGKKVELRKEKLEDSNNIKVVISVKEVDDGILGMQGTLNFNHDDMEILEINELNDDFTITAFNKDNGKFILEASDESIITKENLVTNQDVIEIIFKINKKSKIELTDIKLVDSNLKTIESKNVVLNLSKKLYLTIAIVVIILVFIFAFKKRKLK